MLIHLRSESPPDTHLPCRAGCARPASVVKILQNPLVHVPSAEAGWMFWGTCWSRDLFQTRRISRRRVFSSCLYSDTRSFLPSTMHVRLGRGLNTRCAVCYNVTQTTTHSTLSFGCIRVLYSSLWISDFIVDRLKS